jgi:hypothetical protein
MHQLPLPLLRELLLVPPLAVRGCRPPAVRTFHPCCCLSRRQRLLLLLV